jgi:hypothetical protein
MKIRKEYIDKLKQVSESDLKFDQFEIIKKNTHYLNPKFKEKLIEDVTQIDFNTLYPNLLISLFDEGLIDEKWKEDIERVQWFLKNRGDLKLLSPNEYQQWKIHCNSLYAKIRSPYVTEYMDMFYTDLIEKYGDLIVYNDVDDLYLKIDKVSFQSKEWIAELKDFKHDVEFINYFYAEDLKRYVEQEESGQINTEGFRDENKKENLLNIIKREVRRRKLENLGI